MKKAELQTEIDRLKERLNDAQNANNSLIQAGLIYQRRFEAAFDLLKKLPGCQSHPLWLEIQDFLGQYEVVQHPTYGRRVWPK